MDAAVATQVDARHRDPGHLAHRVLEEGGGPRQGQDRAVMVGVGVDIEQAVAPGLGDGRHDGRITTLAHIDDALEQGKRASGRALGLWRHLGHPGGASGVSCGWLGG
jgi:hypothetical protein